MTSSFLIVVIVSSSWLGSASTECTGGNSVLSVPPSEPSVCLPLDDYIRLQKDASSDGESTDAPPPTSAVSASTPSQSVSSSALLLYRYMSPLWLQTHANFTETPSSVSAQNIEFGTGSTYYGVLFRVKLIEAGILNDDQAYSIQIGFFLTYPSNSDPRLQICDGNYCAGFWYWDPNSAYASYGIDSVSTCSSSYSSSSGAITAPQSSTTNWNIRLEIHPNSTSGITYVSTNSLTWKYSQKLKPSQGLHLKVCRHSTGQTYQFHLFELALYSNK
ncbi:uncharacterized protein [Oscarella lobularis]|uniref:uncharacterized protein isoform X2 n=1 Tax=Oscarella lobularis TaxID=121494 RepID=UPI003313EBAF